MGRLDDIKEIPVSEEELIEAEGNEGFCVKCGAKHYDEGAEDENECDEGCGVWVYHAETLKHLYGTP